MKKLLTLMILLSFALPSNAVVLQESQKARMNQSSSYSQSYAPVKVYNSHGSYQGKLVPQRNGKVKQYSKYGSYDGYYLQQGSQTRYYEKP